MNRKLALNTFTSILYQITTVVCGIILPRLIMKNYGSEVNGLVYSITQFLNVITFLELGVGAIVQSVLYQPLAEHDQHRVDEIVSSAQNFFRTLARILLVYIIILIFVYPYLSGQQFDHTYTALLILVISISSFAQYYFGIVDRLVLSADQLGYIQYTAQIITLVLNVIFCVILIKLGKGIHAVKLTTSLLFLLRPIVLRLYVNRHYGINRKVKYKEEPIKQKWNGTAQHLAAVVLDGTDIIVLTIFSSLANVSIYSVYYLVVNGIKQLFVVATNGIQSLIGELWAKEKNDEILKVFSKTEWLVHTGVSYIFGCTLVLIVPFVQVYTNGVNDTNYNVPLFAVLIVLANALHCLRLPYFDIVVKACNDYKNTQSNFIVTASINIVISIVSVKVLGLIGIAIGTLIAMTYQTVWMAHYISDNLIKWPFKYFVKHILVDVIYVIIAYLGSQWIVLTNISYLSWIVMAIKIIIVWGIIGLIINMIFYRTEMKGIFKSVWHKAKS